jgi:hypothetical protein
MLDDQIGDHSSVSDTTRFHDDARDALAAVDAFLERGDFGAAPELVAIAQVAKLGLAASAAGLGECREETPFASMYPLRENGVFRWCCTHSPPHCSP